MAQSAVGAEEAEGFWRRAMPRMAPLLSTTGNPLWEQVFRAERMLTADSTARSVTGGLELVRRLWTFFFAYGRVGWVKLSV